MFGDSKKGAGRAEDPESCHSQRGPSSFRFGTLLSLLPRVRDKRHLQERTLGMEVREDGSHPTDTREGTVSHMPRDCFTRGGSNRSRIGEGWVPE